MTYFRKGSAFGVNFKAPKDLAGNVEILFPSTDVQTPDYAATIEVTLKHANTLVVIDATDNLRLDVVADEDLTVGNTMLVAVTATGKDVTMTLGTGTKGGTVSILDGNQVFVDCRYDGTNMAMINSSNDTVQDGSITEDKLADDAVTADKIADEAVGTAALADDAVTSDQIADDAVIEAKIADDAVTESKIKDGEVTLAKLATATKGDILYYNAGWQKLPIGQSGQVLKVGTGGIPEWATP